MPNIYDINTSTGNFDLTNDRILMLDASDTTMSPGGSNKTASISSLSQSEKLIEAVNPIDFFVDANVKPNLFATGRLEVVRRDGSLFPFTEFGRTFRNTVNPFFTESETSLIHKGFLSGEAFDQANRSFTSGLSFVRYSGDNFVFERAINPFHYKSGQYNLQFSNLSSLQAHLINLSFETGEGGKESDVATFDLAEEFANRQIDGFFKAGGFINDPRFNQLGSNFDTSLIFPKFSEDANNASELFITPVFSDYQTSSGSATNYYDYLVDTLSNGISQNNSFVNLEMAKLIKNARFGSIQTLTDPPYISPFRVMQPLFSNAFVYDNIPRDDYFVINQDYQFNSGSGVTPSKFISGFIESFTPSDTTGVTGANVAEQHLRYIFHSDEFRRNVTKVIDFRTGSAETQTNNAGDPFIITLPERENPFSTSNTFVADDGSVYTTTISFFNNDFGNDSLNLGITLNGFGNTNINQNYLPNGFANNQPVYISEDKNIEIIYGVTGLQSPVISSISGSGIGSGLASNSGEYTVTISGIYSGASYDIEFNNIEESFYNASGVITGIETNFQSLPISNNFTLTPLRDVDVISFKLLETGITGINASSASGSFSTGDINFIREQKFTPDDLNSNTSGFNWIIRSGTFNNRQELFFYTGDASTIDALSPTGLHSDWIDLTDNSSVNPSIYKSGGHDFLRSSGISGGFILLTFDGLVSGRYYTQEIPTTVSFPGDSDTYLTQSQAKDMNNSSHIDERLYVHAINFTPQSFVHTVEVPYQISGSGFIKTEVDNFLLQENGGRVIDEFTPRFSGIAPGFSGVTGISGVDGVDPVTGIVDENVVGHHIITGSGATTGIGIITGSGATTGISEITGADGTITGSNLISGLTGVSGLVETGGQTSLFVHGESFVYESEEFKIFIPSGTTVL